MRSLVASLALAGLLLLPQSAGATATSVFFPVEDVGLPFWCDWSYDWEARCYTDDGARLPVGGVDDKVWRSALRFHLSLPAGSTVLSARLLLYHDGVCIAPRLRSVRCAEGSYDLDLHRSTSADWFAEREPAFDEVAAAALTLSPATAPQWLRFDVTELVRGWREGSLPNHGVLVKLAEEQEAYDSGGPYAPASSFSDPGVRPRLVVTHSTS